MIEVLTPRPALERWRRRAPLNALILTLIIFVAVVAAFPLAWMVLTSLKTPQETMSVPPVWVPASPSLDAYRKVADVLSLGRSFLNSGIIALVTTTAIDVTSLMAGYAFAKYDFRFRDPLFAILIATMFLPPIVTLIPLYRIVGYLGLNASLAGVVAPNLANAFGIFLMRQFIRGVPNELIEAARLDGASELRLLFQIVAPAVFPALAAHFPTNMQREAMLKFAEALDCVSTALRRDECGDPRLNGRRGHIYASPEGYQIYVVAHPDFNPIERAISKLKSALRRLAERTVAGLFAILQDDHDRDRVQARAARVRARRSSLGADRP